VHEGFEGKSLGEVTGHLEALLNEP
jgi:hypothetical protein